MRFRYIALLFALASCSTVEIPMVGTHVNRGRAPAFDFNLRTDTGFVTTPRVEGTVKEVRDEDGFVINPKEPGDERLIIPTFDLALGLAKKYEIGLSTYRGIFGVINLYEDGPVTLALSPAHVIGKDLNPDEYKVCRDVNGTQECEEKKVNFTGTVENTNVTGLFSYRTSNDYFEGVAYAGIGVNFMHVIVRHNITSEVGKKMQVAPTGLIGVSARALIFDLGFESAMTKIEHRGNSDWVPSSTFHAGLSFGI